MKRLSKIIIVLLICLLSIQPVLAEEDLTEVLDYEIIQYMNGLLEEYNTVIQQNYNDTYTQLTSEEYDSRLLNIYENYIDLTANSPFIKIQNELFLLETDAKALLDYLVGQLGVSDSTEGIFINTNNCLMSTTVERFLEISGKTSISESFAKITSTGGLTYYNTTLSSTYDLSKLTGPVYYDSLYHYAYIPTENDLLELNVINTSFDPSLNWLIYNVNDLWYKNNDVDIAVYSINWGDYVTHMSNFSVSKCYVGNIADGLKTTVSEPITSDITNNYVINHCGTDSYTDGDNIYYKYTEPVEPSGSTAPDGWFDNVLLKLEEIITKLTSIDYNVARITEQLDTIILMDEIQQQEVDEDWQRIEDNGNLGFVSQVYEMKDIVSEKIDNISETQNYILQTSDIEFMGVVFPGMSFDLGQVLENEYMNWLHNMYLIALDFMIYYLLARRIMKEIERIVDTL